MKSAAAARRPLDCLVMRSIRIVHFWPRRRKAL